MKVINASIAAPPIEDLTLDTPVSAPNGSYCAPLYVGLAPAETLGIQFGPAKTTGLVETAHVCYMDLELPDDQLGWVRTTEAAVREQLPGHQSIWFTRDMQPADVSYFFDSSIHSNKLRVQVARSQTFGTTDLHVFTESGELASNELVEGNCTLLGLVMLRGVAHRSGRISLDWVLQQAMVMREAKCLIGLGDAAAARPPPTPAEAKAQVAKEQSARKQEGGGVEEVMMDAAELAPVISPAGNTEMELMSDSDLLVGELEERIEMERQRRAEALREFMEANDLNPEDYYFPDTDEEDEEEEEDDEPEAHESENVPNVGEIVHLA